MSDPRKLIDDEPDDLTSNLLRSALDDDPSPRALHRTAAALGVAGIATGSAKVAGAAVGAKASMKVGSVMALKWFGVGATAGLVIAGGVHLSQQNAEPPLHLEPSMSSVAPAIGAKLQTVRARSVTPDEAPAEAPVEAVEPSRTAPPSPAASSSGSRSTERRPTIASEIAALDRARVALRQNDPATALATIDEIERAGASAPGASALGPEATLIRAQALLARGEKSKAVALARRFIAQNPSSPHVKRMREIAETP
jgi:hypothetical protein